ncbi:uncharacterized protein [Diadema antillarum]|uniref:uncharacterized protein n=1 Tax=Diadema antillarum TaxID=105358 RepID=UPI003A83B2AD
MVAISCYSAMMPASAVLSLLFFASFILPTMHVKAANSHTTNISGPPDAQNASKEVVSYDPKPSTLSVSGSNPLLSLTEGVSRTSKQSSGGGKRGSRRWNGGKKRLTRLDCMPNQFLDRQMRSCVNCTTCYPGTYHESHILCGYGYGSADSCAGCPPGKYQDGVGHNQVNCRVCAQCDHNVVKLSPCNATHDTICGPCPPGQYYAIKNICFDCESEYDSPECATWLKPDSVTPSPSTSTATSTLPVSSQPPTSSSKPSTVLTSLPTSGSPGSAKTTAGTVSPVSSQTSLSINEESSSPSPNIGLHPASPGLPLPGKATKSNEEKIFHINIGIAGPVAGLLTVSIIGIGAFLAYYVYVIQPQRRRESERSRSSAPAIPEVNGLLLPPESAASSAVLSPGTATSVQGQSPSAGSAKVSYHGKQKAGCIPPNVGAANFDLSVQVVGGDSVLSQPRPLSVNGGDVRNEMELPFNAVDSQAALLDGSDDEDGAQAREERACHVTNNQEPGSPGSSNVLFYFPEGDMSIPSSLRGVSYEHHDVQQ